MRSPGRTEGCRDLRNSLHAEPLEIGAEFLLSRRSGPTTPPITLVSLLASPVRSGTSHRMNTRLLFVFLTSSLLAGRAFAADSQVAAPSTGETIELSPFSVTETEDRGYAATSTLSGTRLKTALRDTAVAISVITPELMQDLGVTNANELASFMVNTELDPGSANTANNPEQNSASAARVRGISAGGSQANFFSIPWIADSYNIERLTQTRGPNSLLFGVGNTAGSITSSTNRAGIHRTRPGGKLDLVVDENGTHRQAFDLQFPLVKDRAALRFDFLDEKRRGFMDYDQRRERRFYLTGTVKLADYKNYSAKLTALNEWGHADRNLPDLTTAQDGITAWYAAGRPTVAGTASAANAANLLPGTARASAAPRLVAIDGSPTAIPVLNWNNTARGAPKSQGIGYRLGPDDSPVPLYNNYRGPAVASNYTGRVSQIFLEQTFFRDLSIEIGRSRTNWDLYWVRSGSFQVDVDANQNLPNGQPNPNARQLYVENNFRVQQENRTTSEDRATFAYLFDGQRHSPWLGSWVFSGLVNRQANTQGLDDSAEFNLTPLPGFNAAVPNTQNRIIRRTYLYQGATAWLPSAEYGRNLPPIEAPGLTPGMRSTRAVNDRNEIAGWTFGTQAKLLKDRLVLTYGHRHDDVKRYTAAPVASANGFFDHWRTFGRQLGADFSADTQTFGAVTHLTRWLSAFYSKSESVDLGQPRRDIFGNSMPLPAGTGQDYGLKFSLFDNRLNGSISRYDTRAVNQSINPASNLVPNVALIEDATGLAINVLNRGEIPPDTEDSVSRGYELDLTFNPTRSWRITANASRNENVLSNVALRSVNFIEQRLFPLEATYGSVVTASGDTVSVIMNRFRNQIASIHTAREGAPANELRKWAFNLITNYRFTKGPLSGWSIGGNGQYRSANVLALRVDAAGLPIPSDRILGDDLITFGSHLRYERRFSNALRWSVQLNVANLFDHRVFVRKAADPVSGDTIGWGLRQPRTFRLSSSLAF